MEYQTTKLMNENCTRYSTFVKYNEMLSSIERN